MTPDETIGTEQVEDVRVRALYLISEWLEETNNNLEAAAWETLIELIFKEKSLVEDRILGNRMSGVVRAYLEMKEWRGEDD